MMEVILCIIFLVLNVFCQVVNVVPNGEGHGTVIVCPNGDAIVYNFRKMAQYEPPSDYYDLILDSAYSKWRERVTYIIVSGPEQTLELVHILKQIKEHNTLKKIFLQGRREYYKSDRGFREGNSDLIDYIVKNFPFLDYQFYEDDDYFKKHDFCDDDNIDFILMNTKTIQLPKLNYYRRNKHRGWSLRIKNFLSKKSMTFIQDIESIEQKNLHSMMKRFHEKEKTHVLQLSHYNHEDDTHTNLFKKIQPRMIISQNGCPKTTNVYTPKCEVFEKALKSRSLAKVDPHSLLCSRFEQRIQIRNFNRAIFSTIPTEEWLNLIRYNLSNLTYDIIPILYNGDGEDKKTTQFKHPCEGYQSHKGFREIDDGVVGFLKYMKDPKYLDEVEAKREEEKRIQERKEKEIDIIDEDDLEEEEEENKIINNNDEL